MASTLIYDDAFIAGDTYKMSLVYKDSNGDPIDLTGYTVEMVLRRAVSNNEYSMVKEYVVENSDGVLGEINISLTADDTQYLVEDCNKSYYVYDIQISNADETIVQTLVEGKLEVSRGVTRKY